MIGCLSDFPTQDAVKILTDLSKKKGIMKNIDLELKSTLESLLTEDASIRCNNRLHVTITDPKLRVKIISTFKNKNQLIEVISASCFIPLYSDLSQLRLRATITEYPGKYFDGGLRAFMPPIGDIRVTPFPLGSLRGIYRLYPHIHLPYSQYNIPQLVKWSLIPAEPEILQKLYDDGILAGERYIRSIESK